ncbi:MAG: protein translocase subunit SecD [Tissierellia bacterium]|nr:protein translocase subunit SecD [Tissierellia bacterium]
MNKKSLALLIIISLAILVLALFSFTDLLGTPALVSKLKLGLDIEGGVAIVFEADKKDMSDEEFSLAMEQTQNVLARRIDAFGLLEPNITKQGTSRIRIELPGAKDIDEALAQVGKTAVLSFYQLDNQVFIMDGSPFLAEDFPGKLLFQGDKLETAGVALEDGQPVVTLKLSKEAGEIFSAASRDIVDNYTNGQGQIAIVLDDQIISSPLVSVYLDSEDLIIKGSFTSDEVIMLSSLIRGGALPLDLKEVQTSFINATLGKDALDRSIQAGIFGVVAVILILVIRYYFAGVLASIALILYGSLLFIAMILFKATLTLPGIAGLVLSVGMAVDANVIIFERLKEELALGKSLGGSIKQAFSKAMTTILDSNITTLLAAVILYNFGEGPIKGFAVTLMIGIILSMFTAVIVTRVLINLSSQVKGLSKPVLYGVKGVKNEDC